MDLNLERDRFWAHKDDMVTCNMYGECSVAPRSFGIARLVAVDGRASVEWSCMGIFFKYWDRFNATFYIRV